MTAVPFPPLHHVTLWAMAEAARDCGVAMAQAEQADDDGRAPDCARHITEAVRQGRRFFAHLGYAVVPLEEASPDARLHVRRLVGQETGPEEPEEELTEEEDAALWRETLACEAGHVERELGL